MNRAVNGVMSFIMATIALGLWCWIISSCVLTAANHYGKSMKLVNEALNSAEYEETFTGLKEKK